MNLIPAALGLIAALFNYLSDKIKRGIRFRFQINLFIATLILTAALLGIRLGVPLTQLSIWQVSSWPLSMVGFVFDLPGWFFAVALSALLLMSVSATQGNPADAKLHTWGLSFMLTSAGLLAVLAANPLTLMIAWALIDLTEFGYAFIFYPDSSQSSRLIIKLAYRLFGILALIVAFLIAPQTGGDSGFGLLTSTQTVLVIFAAALRLGLLPPFAQLESSQNPLSMPIRAQFSIVPAAGGLILLSRADTTNLSTAWVYVIVLLALFAAIYSALLWLADQIRAEGKIFWLLGFAALALASAVLAGPGAAFAWASAGIVGSAYLYFRPHRSGMSRIFTAILSLAFIGLPFTPTWNATRLFDPPGILLSIGFVFPLVLLALGWLRKGLQPVDGENFLEAGNYLIANLVSVLLMIFFLGAGIWMVVNGAVSGNNWSGVLVLVCGMMLALINRRFSLKLPPELIMIFQRIVSMEWIGRFAWGFYRQIARYINLLNSLLEGESGTLWSFLALIILISLALSFFA